MTTNAFVLSWDCEGLEAAVPITQYEEWDHQNLVDVLAGNGKKENPLGRILGGMKLRAMVNSQRFYEIYAIDCDPDMTQDEWHMMFKNAPQAMAELIREKGVKIFCNRRQQGRVLIT